MTYLQLVNATLRRLRRQEVTSVAASDYSKLVGDLVNLAKREVEDSWDWLGLMTELDLSVTSGTDTYALTGFGERYWIKQVHNTTNKGVIYPQSQARINRDVDLGTSNSGQPSYWRIYGSTGDDPNIHFYPSPNASISVTVYAKVAQADLSADGDELTVPHYPVLTGAYLRAFDERGEDGGSGLDAAVNDYRMALADAIAQDNANRAAGNASDWQVA